MPIETSIPLLAVSQSDFSRVAYEVVGHAFNVHSKLGRIFDEVVYRKTLAHLLSGRAAEGLCIRLTHSNFEKRLFIDLVVDGSCPFELKAKENLHDRHRSQLIQYLMLAGVHHGKLINFGTEQVQHEFVNCHETTEHRRAFRVDTGRWSTTAAARGFEDMVVSLIRDWGTGLHRGLYVEAVSHLLGGVEAVRYPVDTLWSGTVTGRQYVNLAGDNTAFEITCLRGELETYEKHLIRFLANTRLERIFWVNVVSGLVCFVELRRQG